MNLPPKHNETVLAYHERTKHHIERYARGPAHINWNAKPDSYRRYTGAKCFELPLVADTLTSAYVNLYRPKAITQQPITLNKVAALLELSLGLSAWKQYENERWALRCNPSSGNLHPTEGYVVLPKMLNIPAGVYHYLSEEHVLEHRGILGASGVKHIGSLLSNNSFLIGLSSIPWREMWKYGERSFRYCQHDIGHAIAAIRYAAATLGWQVLLLEDWADTDILVTLGLDQEEDFHTSEREIPEVMLCISATEEGQHIVGSEITDALINITWKGIPNILDTNHHYEWPLVETVINATYKPLTEKRDWIAPPLPPLLPLACNRRAINVIRQRRSAQLFDAVTHITTKAFYRLLDSTLPRPGAAPWDVFRHRPLLHLILFVHRVTGLSPGVYILLRCDGVEEEFQIALQREHFNWIKQTGCPKHFQLYQLVSGDAKTVAQQISCHQEIAADSAFSLGMLSEFHIGLQYGPWAYRQFFWEAGMIGQVLYLEAEALGLRGTGIGCYFDDVVHNLLGLISTRYQSIYHFSVGTPPQDKHLQTLPPYAHLKREKKQ
ncbi:MAG: SagB/ThcOx family dehydrogenase [Thiomargarita sp.]|nr:SagB/ThcOx family dehydrogenase [Thiomargarita sp.]